MDLCYIFRQNAITSDVLATAEVLLTKFHRLRQIFITEGVRVSISLPRQHALSHYLTSIPLFGSPNGLCSSITESKHIKAVKEPWRRSSRFRALIQMLRTIIRLEKLAALRRRFLREGLLLGSTAGNYDTVQPTSDTDSDDDDKMEVDDIEDQSKSADNERLHDAGPDGGPQSMSSIILAAAPGIHFFFFLIRRLSYCSILLLF